MKWGKIIIVTFLEKSVCVVAAYTICNKRVSVVIYKLIVIVPMLVILQNSVAQLI